MTYLAAIILGIVEGATEFIPVSSSGHLIIARDLLGIGGGAASGLAFDAIVQAATILAVAVYFWRDLWGIFMTAVRWATRKPVEQKDRILLGAVVIGTIPAIIFGLLLEKNIETVFRDVNLVVLTLVLGGVLMLVAEWWASLKGACAGSDTGENAFNPDAQNLTLKKGVGIGFFQCLALVPGVSRSGATISGGLFFGLTRSEATRFSFLLSFPVIVGAGAKKLIEVLISPEILGTIGLEILLASFVAFVVGLASIHFLIKYLRTHTLHVFVWYRFVLAGAMLLFLWR